MSDDPAKDEDLVRVRPRRSSGERIEIDIEEERASASRTPPRAGRAGVQAGDFEVVLQSAALLMGEARIPIPATGLTLGTSPAADDVTIAGADSEEDSGEIQATVEATASGHVIVEQARRSETFVNGERLIVGERRPLRRGDSIALAGRLLHYLPPGTGLPRLAPVAPVDIGRLRTSRQEFTVGRDPACDLVLDHPTVSRRHAVIRMDDGRPTIEDQDSAVGVRVNGVAIRRAPLDIGDQLAIGPYRIVFDGEELFEREASPGLAVVAAEVTVDVESGTILQPTSLHLRAGGP